MAESLSSTLRAMRADSLLRQVETIRDYAPGRERTAEAERYIREAMLQYNLGTITHEERYRIFSILSFGMPNDGWSSDEGPPLDSQEVSADDLDIDPAFDAACFLGCPACDEGGRMVDD